MTLSAIPAALRHPAPESPVVRIRRFIGSLPRRRDQNAIVAPQIVAGQVRATPPAVNRVVAAEVFLVSENGSAEIGDAQPASPVSLVALVVPLPRDRSYFII